RPSRLANSFFAGMGGGYAKVFGIILSAITFVDGIRSVIGVESKISGVDKEAAFVGVVAAGVTGGFTFCVGSGDAVVNSFTTALVSSAADLRLGSVVWVVGEMVRSASPVSAVTGIIVEEASKCSKGDSPKVSGISLIGLTCIPIGAGVVVFMLLMS